MTALSLVLISAVLALSSAKPWYQSNDHNQRGESDGYFDNEGRYHARAMSYNNNPYRETLAQTPEAGLDLCKSAQYDVNGLTTFVHVCQAGKDSSGKYLNLCLF